MSTLTLTGPQRAAIFVLQLPKDKQKAVLKEMRDAEVDELMQEIVRLETVPADTVWAVKEHLATAVAARKAYVAGGIEEARRILEMTYGPVQSGEMVDRLVANMVEKPFEFLRRADPRQVQTLIQDEHPQTIALVMGYMRSEDAAMTLAELPMDVRAKVATRVARMDRTSPEVIEVVEEYLQRRLSTAIIQTTEVQVGGIQALVDVLNRADRTTEREVLEGLEPTIAEEVRQRMLVFEDIAKLDDQTVQTLVAEIEHKQLVLALKGVKPEVKEKVFRNVSASRKETIQEDLAAMGRVPLKEAEEARGAVVKIMRDLEELGRIVLTRTGDDEEFVE